MGAKGKKAKVQVWRGKKVKTSTGLTKADLVKSKSRKIVSVKKSEIGKKSKWARATAKARAEKGYQGFKAIKRGTSFYDKATDHEGPVDHTALQEVPSKGCLMGD